MRSCKAIIPHCKPTISEDSLPKNPGTAILNSESTDQYVVTEIGTTTLGHDSAIHATCVNTGPRASEARKRVTELRPEVKARDRDFNVWPSNCNVVIDYVSLLKGDAPSNVGLGEGSEPESELMPESNSSTN